MQVGCLRRAALRLVVIVQAASIVFAMAACTPKLSPSPTPTLILIPTSAPSATPIPTQVAALSTSGPACQYNADFEADVTIPDSTTLAPEAAFVKTWRMRNTGSCAWDDHIRLAFIAGSQLGGPASIPVPATPPGTTVDLSVSLVAPKDPGSYTGLWGMQSPDGAYFGTHVFVTIVVPAPTRSPTTPQGDNEGTPPTISGVTAHSRQIFLASQAGGNRADVFSKVGDSISDAYYFLYPIGDNVGKLGGHGGLNGVIGYFSSEKANTNNSFNNQSLATHGAWKVSDLLNPAAAGGGCDGRTPVVCEYEIVKPSVAIIMIGTNDCANNTPPDSYQADLAKVVDATLSHNVIPVLTTITWTTYCDVTPFNQVITSTARSYDIPLIDYYTAAYGAPNHGISDDGVHPSYPADNNSGDFSADHLTYGYNIRNLVTLQMLNVLWRQVLY